MQELKLYKCEKCGKIIAMLPGACACPTMCCGEPMKELVANTTEAAFEKHIPAVEINGNKVHVQVGSILHPLLEAHHISFVILVTDKEIRRHDFEFTDVPEHTFALDDGEKQIAVYEYCNLHGLWVNKLD